MQRLLTALLLIGSAVVLSGCRDDQFELQRQCQTQRGSWDSYHGVCSYQNAPQPTVTVTRTVSP